MHRAALDCLMLNIPALFVVFSSLEGRMRRRLSGGNIYTSSQPAELGTYTIKVASVDISAAVAKKQTQAGAPGESFARAKNNAGLTRMNSHMVWAIQARFSRRGYEQ